MLLTPKERETLLKEKGYRTPIVKLVNACTWKEADNWTLILIKMPPGVVGQLNRAHAEVERAKG